MKQILLLASVLTINIFQSQKCADFSQNIDSNGRFNISFNEKIFNEIAENTAEVIDIKEQNDPELLSQFQKKFPEIYDGKCLKTNTKHSSDDFYFCDKASYKDVPEDRLTNFGTFQLTFIIDDYYFFKYSAFEISGYLMYSAKENLFYSFTNKPIISYDKKILYSYTNNPYFGFNLKILELYNYRELGYHLKGDFKVKDVKLLKYKNSENYSLLLDLKEERKIRNEKHEIIGSEYCDRKIKID